MSQIFRGVSITLFSSGVFFVVNFLLSITLNPTIYGELSAAINSITLIGLVISSGISFYIVSIGCKDSLKGAFDFSFRFFVASCCLTLVSLFIYWIINNGGTVETILYAFPAAASIGFCLVMVGYFQLAENYSFSAAMSSIPNLIKSAALLYMAAPVFWVIDSVYTYRLAGILLYLICLCALILVVFRRKDKNSSKTLHHNAHLAAKFVFSNFVVSAYTSMVIPVVYLTYGADHSAAFSIFFIFWSLLNIVTGYLYGNHYLIKLKLIYADNGNSKAFFYKTIKLGAYISLIITISSIAVFKFGSFYFWSEYAAYENIILFLLVTLGFRSISAAAGLFLSLGDWVKWKNIAQCIFVMTLYFPIISGANFDFFVAAYGLAEIILMIIYLFIAYIRVHPPTRQKET
ncbi:hypothetical protein [Pseudomonas sp. BF-R-05]|jgi:hypothetical protein|uniref:hypothetical protein n=1 Tax=Pseudomonas sp. BF-R-05 TaxID=2832364 RepID=UPI001CC07A92|nr:hypothetical protein [Pseudomonas sp. BF-R-05]